MRGGSKGVKGKNYRNLLGKPLMSYTINCALNSVYLDDVIISSDSDLIFSITDCAVTDEFCKELSIYIK